MARTLTHLVGAFRREIDLANDLALRVERARSLPGTTLSLSAVELSYELAFLKIFLAWEVLLEQTFLRLLCGYRRSGALEPLKAGVSYRPTLQIAETTLLGRNRFLLWHDPVKIIRRANIFFSHGNFELVISSSQARLAWFSAVRHRVAHAQRHAQFQFDAATMRLAGKRYLGARPGRFLRDWQTGANPPRRWLTAIGDELLGLATQLNS